MIKNEYNLSVAHAEWREPRQEMPEGLCWGAGGEGEKEGDCEIVAEEEW